jgi:Ca-activated chloride channel family protein
MKNKVKTPEQHDIHYVLSLKLRRYYVISMYLCIAGFCYSCGPKTKNIVTNIPIPEVPSPFVPDSLKKNSIGLNAADSGGYKKESTNLENLNVKKETILSKPSVVNKMGIRSLSNTAQYASGLTSKSSGISGRASEMYIDKKPVGQKEVIMPDEALKYQESCRKKPRLIPEDSSKSGESYAKVKENEFKSSVCDPLSTFSIDVDNASYTNIRRMLLTGQSPPADAVRIEELINYFDYDYKNPADERPFAVSLEAAECPWNNRTRVVHIGIKGMDVDRLQLPPSNLVFLVDVSGSMSADNKLPLVKRSLELLVRQMRTFDRVAIVTYAGSAGLALPSTLCKDSSAIFNSIRKMEAGGSTAGGAGIQLAYKVASDNFLANGNNRVILVTDGDFNVGLNSDQELKRLIEGKRKSGIYITVCGFGMGNYKDSKLENIADYGNGNYYYIDNYNESKKVFVSGLTGTLMTIAKDVKIQVEFNPAQVKAYRLIGYENRVLEAEDFKNDKKDAGELGAGHTVTALYEIIPAGSTMEIPGFKNVQPCETGGLNEDFREELLTIRLRYKLPKSEKSTLIEFILLNNSQPDIGTSDNLTFSCGVAMFGMLLKKSEYSGGSSYELAEKLISSSQLNMTNGYRDELLVLIGIAKR